MLVFIYWNEFKKQNSKQFEKNYDDTLLKIIIDN